MRKGNIFKIGTMMLCFFLLLNCVPTLNIQARENKIQQNSQVHKKIRVGWYEDSYHILSKNGNRSGYGYEYEQALSAYTGWDYEYVTADWSKLIDMLQQGKIDMMSALSYTDERANTMLFSDSPMGEEKYYLYVDLANSNISTSDLSSLNNQPIGMMEKSVQATQFYDWEEKNNVHTKHVYVDSIDQAKEMFAQHELVGVISTETNIWVDAGLSSVFTIGGSNIYFGINKNRPDIKEELDNAMREMESDKPFYADELYQRYIATQSVSTLSQVEQNWISQHDSIRIGYLVDDIGFSILDSQSGKIKGIINDYTNFAKTCFAQPLKFKLKGYATQKAQIKALHEGKIDMIFHVNQNPYYAEKNDLSLSNTVLSIPLAAVTWQNAFDENAQNTVAISDENTKFKWYISYNYPGWKILSCKTDKEAETLVRNKKADCLITRSAKSMQYVNDRNLHSVFLTKTANVSFATEKGNSTLVSILNKTLEAMQTSKLTGAVSMYEDASKKVSILDFVKDNLVMVLCVLISIVCIIFTIIVWLLKKARYAESKAKEAQRQAEQANQAKSNFLFNMSHDIRTPMNALLGYNQLMKQELKDSKLLHYQKQIEQSGNLLLSIINNVLDMARIESGRMELDENYGQINDIIEEVIGVFEPLAQKKGVSLSYEIHVKHQHIVCDVIKVKQIFLNLVSNAVKYTFAPGNVVIQVNEISCSKEGHVQIQTRVRDTGIGMSESYLPYLFDSFSRERNTTMGKVAGTGLGMSIVKKLVEMMNGTIEVKSELGKGTDFVVVLTHKIADEKYYVKNQNVKINVQNEVLKGKHILLAEDNDLNAEISITILENMGMVVDRVEDGLQCVNKIEQSLEDTYDLILMDIQMPNMDGYKATQIIRELSNPMKSSIPIVAMTANAFEEDKKIAFSKGMNAHIAKPIDMDKMKEVLCMVLAHYKTKTTLSE